MFTITHSSIEGPNDFGTKLTKLAEPRYYGTTQAERDMMRAGQAGAGTHFKLYDDDANCYYTGKFYGDADSEDAFEPLDWATYYAGCTYIKYRNADGTYSTL